MLFKTITRTPFTPGERRRFRTLVSLLVAVVVVTLALQYTGHALLPARKTDTLWGLLTGMVVAGIGLDLLRGRWAPRDIDSRDESIR